MTFTASRMPAALSCVGAPRGAGGACGLRRAVLGDRVRERLTASQNGDETLPGRVCMFHALRNAVLSGALFFLSLLASAQIPMWSRPRLGNRKERSSPPGSRPPRRPKDASRSCASMATARWTRISARMARRTSSRTIRMGSSNSAQPRSPSRATEDTDRRRAQRRSCAHPPGERRKSG